MTSRVVKVTNGVVTKWIGDMEMEITVVFEPPRAPSFSTQTAEMEWVLQR